MTTKWLWPRKLRTTIPSVPHTSCHSTPFPDLSPLPLPGPCQQTLGRVPRATLLEAGSGLARGACGPGARNSPCRPAPSPLPAGRRPGPARPAPTQGANRLWNRGIARESAPRAREGKPPGFPGEASERGGAGGGVSEGLERVLSKTGPRTKRNPRCELADPRRLLLLPWQAVSPQDSARVPSLRAPRGRGGPRSRLNAGPRPHATPRARRRAGQPPG